MGVPIEQPIPCEEEVEMRGELTEKGKREEV